MSLTDADRTLPLVGAFNFRDLGGYRTTDGRQVKWRTLFRADGLTNLTPEDLDDLARIDLRTVVDLRTTMEIDERGRFPFESHPLTFHHLSVIDQTWDREAVAIMEMSTTEFLHWAYTGMLADGAARFARAFDLLADTDALPAVFHCAAGKDRTGLLAALVLGALGVERDSIVADYVLTEVAMERILDRLRETPERAEYLATTPKSFFAADGDAMHRVIDDIERDHGSIRDFTRSIGVSEATLERLDGLLLEDVA